jgi:hypothetical protein
MRISWSRHPCLPKKKKRKEKERIHARGERQRELALLLNGILASICISDIIKLSLSGTN